jgi:thioredoxin 1
LKSDKPVMVDFKQHGVDLVEWLTNHWWTKYWVRRKVVIGKIDVDANQEFAAKYGWETYQRYLFFS